MVEDNTSRGGVADAVVGVVEVPEPSGGRQASREGMGGGGGEQQSQNHDGRYGGGRRIWTKGKWRRQTTMTWRQKGGGLGGLILALEPTGILTQDTVPGGTTLDDANNGFDKLNRRANIWTVFHR